MTGTFYICATPIGNMGDISLRAIEILKNVDFIACEDTRVTMKLAEKYEITAHLLDCHKFNEKERSIKIISLLNEGYNIALVSDAGTPLISDPGSFLIEELLKNNIKITSIPGACAVTTFLSMLPRYTEEYVFIGFIPRTKKQQTDILNKYINTNCVFFESPQRLLKTLENIKETYGAEIKMSVGRELTKIFEEIITDKVSNIIDYYKKNILKGEIVAMIYAHSPFNDNNYEIIQKISILKSEGYSTKDISKIISLLFNVNKNDIYKLAECSQNN